MNVVDFMTSAEKEIQKLIKTDAFFSDVDVYTGAGGQLVSLIQQALAGIGLFVVIRMLGGPIPQIGDQEMWGCNLEITENPLLNHSNKTARLCLQKLIKVLSGCPWLVIRSVRNLPQEGMVLWLIEGQIPVHLPSPSSRPAHV